MSTAELLDLNRLLEKQAGMSELGVSGLRHTRGVIIEEPLRTLQGDRGRRIYREMSANDDVVGAALLAIRMLVRQVPWWEEPFDNDPDNVAAAEFLGEVREDMSHSWESFIEEVLSLLIYGWSLHEIVWKRRNGPNRQPGLSSKYTDGRIGIRKLPIRSQDTLARWELDEDGGIQAMEQRCEGRTYVIPIDKALLFRFGVHKNNPEGVSALRNAWRSWWFKKRVQEIEAIGIERDLAGLPVAGVPPHILDGTTAEDRAILENVKDIVVNVRRDEQEGIVWPLSYDDKGNKLYDIWLLTTGGTRQFDTDKTINRYDRGIAGSLLADFILLGHEQHGSFALSSDKTSLFAVALGSLLDSIAATLNRHLVPRLFRLNGLDTTTLPEWRHGDIEKVSLKEVAEFIEAMARSGAPLFPDDELEGHVRELAGLPAKSAEAEEITGFGLPMEEEEPEEDEGRMPPAPTEAEVEEYEEKPVG